VKNQRVAVTGGAGFIGSHLTKALLGAESSVLVIDNFCRGFREFLPPNHPQLTVEDLDIREVNSVCRILADFQPEVVFHLAAHHFIPFCNLHPREVIEVNILGTQSVLEACTDLELRRIVFASSAAVFAPGDQPHREEELLAPQDIYGTSKQCGEQLVNLFARQSRVECAVARLFNVYGPSDTNAHVIPDILGQVCNGSEKINLGNLEPKRDFIHVDDVASALVALGRSTTPPASYNVGTGQEHSVEGIVRILGKLLHREIRIQQSPSLSRPSDCMHLCADIRKISTVVGWYPKIALETGLSRLVGANSS